MIEVDFERFQHFTYRMLCSCLSIVFPRPVIANLSPVSTCKSIRYRGENEEGTDTSSASSYPFNATSAESVAVRQS